MKIKSWLKKTAYKLLSPGDIKTVNLFEKQYRIRGRILWNDYDEAWSLALAWRSQVVFDVGCNIGQNALLNLYSNSIEQIVLIDANKQALSVAAENLIYNNFSHKAVFIPAFASDKTDSLIDFFTTGTGAAGSMYKDAAVTASKNGDKIKVRTITLDTIAFKYGFPDYIKIDVEGAENLVLNGCRNIAYKQVCKFLVEMHSNPSLSMRANAELILNWCSENSYFAYYLAEMELLTEASQIENRGRCHLLLLPQQDCLPEYLYHIKQSAGISDVFKYKGFEAV